MRTLFLLLAVVVAARASSPESGLVLVEGGPFKNAKSNFHGKDVTIPSFYLGRYEVTQKEWVEVMGTNPSQFKADDRPVEMVSWYDAIEYCNARSLREGLTPCYRIDKRTRDPHNHSEFDDLKWTVTFDRSADGYRLPTEAEWEYAAGGGQASKGYTYSGSNEIADVAWYWQNSGDRPLSGAWNWPLVERNHGQTHRVGAKQPNELGFHDLSGNVREWCWDWYGELTADGKPAEQGEARMWKGGGWMGGDFCCESSYRSSHEPNGQGPDQGLRVCRNK